MKRPAHRLPALAAACLVLAGPAAAQPTADRIWSGGPILTMNDAAMRAEAVAEKDGRIIAVGSAADVMKTRGAATRMIDLGGRTMLPGFVDAHGHVFGGGLQALSANVLPPPDGQNNSIARLQRILRDWMAANPQAVEKVGLIAGFGYDESQLEELRHPTRDDLDAVSKDLPVFIVQQSGHFGVLNSKALEVVGYTAETKNPDGGVIRRRDGSQEPNGVLEEAAWFPALGKLLTRTGKDGAKEFARAGAELWARFGYTTAEEGRSVPATAQILREVADAGGFKIDVVTYADVLVDRDFIKKNYSATYKNRLRVGGAKLTIDGAPQTFTGWRDRPYYKPVGDHPEGYSGYPAITEEQGMGSVDWAYANDIPILIHSNGEAANDLLIKAVDAAVKKHGLGDRRTVGIHLQVSREDHFDSFKSLAVVPSFHPMHTFYWGDWHREHVLGPVDADNIAPLGWAVARGMKFGSHHDAPVAFPDSMRILDAIVTRRSRSGDVMGARHRVDVITGLKSMTIWPAWFKFEEEDKGSIEAGKLADFVILDKNPLDVDPDTLDQLKVTETIKEGETVYTRSN